MIKRILCGVILFALAIVTQAATIDKLHLAPFGNYSQDYSPANGLMNLGTPDFYELDNGSTWESGAGGFFSYKPAFSSEDSVGTTIRYRFQQPSNGVLWDYDDYNSGDHSSSAQLSLVGNLVVEAEIGSKTATITGFTHITENTYANYTDDRFNFFSAPVGSVVPFSITFTIRGSETFSPDLFSRPFEYYSAGIVDFTNIIPVPLAQNDSAVTYIDNPIAIDVLSNDIGFIDPVSVTTTTGPSNGSVAVQNSPGNAAIVRMVYTPNSSYVGSDSFDYQVSDGFEFRSATVDVMVLSPVAAADSVTVKKGASANVAILENDEGFSDPVTVAVTSGPTNGVAQVTGSPGEQAGIVVSYTPAANFVGTDSLVYEVSDGVNARSATVSIAVVDFQAVPDALAALRSSCCNQLRILENDIGFGGQVTVSITQPPDQNGTATVRNSPGQQSDIYVDYRPYYNAGPVDYTETFEYEVSDGTFTDRAQVTVSVVDYIAQNDETSTPMGQSVQIPIGANDIGFDYPATVGVFLNPQHGNVQLSGSPGNVSYATAIYTPDPGFLGTDVFEYATDDGTQISIATVTIHVIIDSDNDGVDDRIDNCLGTGNANQRDTDGDRFGNRCDADLNNDGYVNFADLAIFRSVFASNNAHADFDGSGTVNFADLAIMRQYFAKAPGPSGLN